MNSRMPPTMTAPDAGKIRHRVIARWHQRALGFSLIVFAFAVGLFLLVFPWITAWDLNWIPVHSPRLLEVWMNRYFRGAVSGLGLLNIYIALAELGRQIRSLFREP